jgi:hypothetical protein
MCGDLALSRVTVELFDSWRQFVKRVEVPEFGPDAPFSTN